jgi:hypothetical protein
LLVLGVLERVGEVRTLLIHHLNFHAHGLGNDQNIREDDGGVEQTGVTLDGLESQGRGDLGVPAACEEISRALGLVVLGQVSTG